MYNSIDKLRCDGLWCLVKVLTVGKVDEPKLDVASVVATENELYTLGVDANAPVEDGESGEETVEGSSTESAGSRDPWASSADRDLALPGRPAAAQRR